MAESENAIAVLPQPYVTAAQLRNENIKIALSLTDEWEKVCDTPLITGVTVAQKSVIEENTAAFDDFLGEYQASVDFVNENTDEAAELIGGYDIVKAPVAKKALPILQHHPAEGRGYEKRCKRLLECAFRGRPQGCWRHAP